MLIRLLEVDVYDEEEINAGEGGLAESQGRFARWVSRVPKLQNHHGLETSERWLSASGGLSPAVAAHRGLISLGR